MKTRGMSRRRKLLLFAPLGILAMIGFVFLVMYLWNSILVSVIHVGIINFWQALGILVLCKILFGGFRGGPQGRPMFWRQRMMHRWDNMTPEEREKFREQLKSRCGGRFEREEAMKGNEPAS